MWTRQQLKANGKMNFKRNYWPCVLVAFLMTLVESAVTSGGSGGGSQVTSSETYYGNQDQILEYGNSITSMFGGINLGLIAIIGVAGIFFTILVGNVMRVGGNLFFIQNRDGEATPSTVFKAFTSGDYGNIVVTMVLKDIFIFLWTLLFIVPGIIKSYEYMMVPYILAENPGMDRKAAFAISKRMMNGQKMDAFLLDLSFIGWDFLGVMTFGLLNIFFVQPYREATITELYAYSKSKAFEEGYIR